MDQDKQTKQDSDADYIHRLTLSDSLEVMGTRITGLTEQEAENNRVKYGPNSITKKKEKSIVRVFLTNFISLMAILLWFAGGIAIVADMPQLGIAIWLVNIINGVFSFWQEFRASKATEALKSMLPSYARVIRDGQEQQILAEALVPGDIILLQEGDKISAYGKRTRPGKTAICG